MNAESKKVIMHYPDGSVRIESYLKGTVAIFSNRSGALFFRHFDARGLRVAKNATRSLDLMDPVSLWQGLEAWQDIFCEKEGTA